MYTFKQFCETRSFARSQTQRLAALYQKELDTTPPRTEPEPSFWKPHRQPLDLNFNNLCKAIVQNPTDSLAYLALADMGEESGEPWTNAIRTMGQSIRHRLTNHELAQLFHTAIAPYPILREKLNVIDPLTKLHLPQRGGWTYTEYPNSVVYHNPQYRVEHEDVTVVDLSLRIDKYNPNFTLFADGTEEISELTNNDNPITAQIKEEVWWEVRDFLDRGSI